MKRITHNIFCGLLVILLASCQFNEPKKTIAVFSPYMQGSRPYLMLDSILHEEFSTSSYKIILMYGGFPIRQYLESPQYFVDSHEVIEQSIDTMSSRPDLIMLYGDDMAYSAALSQHHVLNQVPSLCFGVYDPEWNDILRKKKNFVVLQSRAFIKENLNFIRNIGVSTSILTCLDSTFLDDFLRKTVHEQMGDDSRFKIYDETPLDLIYHPEMREENKMTLAPISLMHEYHQNADTVQSFSVDVNDILHLSQHRMTLLRMKDDHYSNIAFGYFTGPYFSLTPEVFNLPLVNPLNACLGGYFTAWPDMLSEVHRYAKELLNGTDPQTVPWKKLRCKYWLDWRIAKHIHPYAEDFPKYVRFVNLPWECTSRLHMSFYRHVIPVTLLLLLFFAIIVPAFLALLEWFQRRQLIRQGLIAKDNEQKIKETFAAINAYHFLITKDLKLILSQGVSEIFGTDIRPIDVRVAMRFIRQPQRDKLYQFITQSPTNDEMDFEVMVHSFGSKEYHPLKITLIHLDEYGEYLYSGFVILNEDAYKAEKSMQEAFHLSEEVTAKESFLAAMGHEIRTPLNAIVGFSRVLLDHNHDLTNEEKSMYGRYILQSNDQMLHLLENVMNYSRRNGDQMRLELSRHNVDKLMDEIYVIQSVIVPNHLKFNYIRGPKDLEIKVNRTSVHQILSNLVNNAIKFTIEGSITLGWDVFDPLQTPIPAHDGSDSTNADLLKQNHLVIYVEDTGIGIASDKVNHVFDRYFKENNQTVGAGIGLHLCRDFVNYMGGMITVQSELGKGSRFEVRLPLLSS